jgi:hypothetical protein
MPVNDFFDFGIDLALVGNVERNELAGAAGIGKLLERLLSRGMVRRVVDHHARAASGKIDRDRAADPAAGAGDQCDLTV